jgi:hypothetical protein
MRINHANNIKSEMLIKKIGGIGFLFFFAKGMLWLLVPLFMAYFGLDFSSLL